MDKEEELPYVTLAQEDGKLFRDQQVVLAERDPLKKKLTFLPLLGAILQPTVGAGTSTSLEKNWNSGVKESRCEKQKNLRTFAKCQKSLLI